VGGLFAAGSIAAALLVLGLAAIALGGIYLGSPAWRLVVVIDEHALEVWAGSASRFRLPWDEVVRVVVSPVMATCFVDGGTPARSLLVPGIGAPASYDIEDRPALVAAILARTPADRVSVVDLLERAPALPVGDQTGIG
jgi:hypothetical protein